MNKIPAWAIFLIGAIIAILFLRFCTKVFDKKQTLIDTTSIQKQHIYDSLKSAARENALIDSAKKIRGRLDSVTARLKSTDAKINTIVAANKKLIAKANWGYFKDTSASLVPAEFVNDCKDCLSQLQTSNDAIDKLRYEHDQITTLYLSQAQIDSIQLEECQQQKQKLNKQYNDIAMAINLNSKLFEPKRKLKIGIAGRLSDLFLPNGIGPVVMYEDKKDRNFGFRPIYGNGKPQYIIDVLVPFSLKK